MGNRRRVLGQFLAVLFILSTSVISASAQTTAFTYQGLLSTNGVAANGNFDLQFSLFDLVQNGSQKGSTITVSNVPVVNGIFTVQLDFGSTFFVNNAAQFIEIGVRISGLGGAFSVLVPRVPLTPTPYAIRSISAGTADTATTAITASTATNATTATTATTATNATQLGGVAANQYVLTTDTRLSDARSPIGGSANYIQNGAGLQAGSQFNISGNGTAGGTLSANIVNATSQYNIGGSVVLDAAVATQNTLVGLQTGTGGTNLTAVGFQAGKVSTGNNNTFIGSAAGLSNLGAGQNTFMGQGTGPQNTTGANNSFYGTQAGFNNVGGGSNSFFGVTAGNLNTSGGSNAFFGLQAGFSNSSGSSNTAVGKGAGFFSTIGSNNTFVGFSAGPPNGTGDLNQSAAIGANAVVTTDNTIVLGTSTETTEIPGKLKVSTLGAAGATALCRNASQQLSTCSSSLRYKTNLTPYSRGMDIIDHLNPIAFSWKADGMRDLGFGAEDVAKIEPLLVTYNAQGQIEGLKYDRITVALVNAVKEQQKQIADQTLQIDALKKLVCADHPSAGMCTQK